MCSLQRKIFIFLECSISFEASYLKKVLRLSKELFFPKFLKFEFPGPAGAVSEDDFRKMFTTVPQCIITSDADAAQQLANAQKILERTDEDWSKRQNAVVLFFREKTPLLSLPKEKNLIISARRITYFENN